MKDSAIVFTQHRNPPSLARPLDSQSFGRLKIRLLPNEFPYWGRRYGQHTSRRRLHSFVVRRAAPGNFWAA